MNSLPPIAKHALAAQIEEHLLCTVGVASEDASRTDLMRASTLPRRDGWFTCRWNS
jgi:starch phosphorylase